MPIPVAIQDRNRARVERAILLPVEIQRELKRLLVADQDRLFRDLLAREFPSQPDEPAAVAALRLAAERTASWGQDVLALLLRAWDGLRGPRLALAHTLMAKVKKLELGLEVIGEMEAYARAVALIHLEGRVTETLASKTVGLPERCHALSSMSGADLAYSLAFASLAELGRAAAPLVTNTHSPERSYELGACLSQKAAVVVVALAGPLGWPAARDRATVLLEVLR